MTGGELYKGTSRFGANRVWTTKPEANAGVIGGDLYINAGVTEVFDGVGKSWVGITNKNGWSAATYGGAGSYIQEISQAADGTVTATAVPFNSKVKEAIGNGSVSGSGNGITVSVATTSGVVTSVQVSAATLSVDTITAATGNFTNLNVSNTASFVATTVSADTLTIGGKTVEQIAGEQIAASTLSGSITAPGGTNIVNEGQVVTYVSAAVSSFDNAMHYIGTTSDPAIVQDATAVPSDISGYTSAKRKSGDIVLKGTEEYIWNGSKWEKIGDQSAVTGGGSGVTVSGVTVSVAIAAATAFPSVTVKGIGTAATKDYVATNMASDGTGLPTESAVAAYVKTFADAADAKASTGTSTSTYGGLTAVISLYSNSEPTIVFDDEGVVTTSTSVETASPNLVTAGAVADYVDGKIGALDASVTSSENSSLKVGIKEENGVVTGVTADLVWLNAQGAVI